MKATCCRPNTERVSSRSTPARARSISSRSTRRGAAFRTQYKVFLKGDDPWFRPVDACTAPDGSVFVADWYDAGVGGHAFSDQTTGRIYRVAPRGHRSPKVEFTFASIGDSIEALKSPNIATQDAARRRLIDLIGDKPANDRRAAKDSPIVAALAGLNLVSMLAPAHNEVHRARAPLDALRLELKHRAGARRADAGGRRPPLSRAGRAHPGP